MRRRIFALLMTLTLSAALFQAASGCSTSTPHQGVMTGNPTSTPTPPATVQPALFIPEGTKEVYNANFIDALTVMVEQRQASDKTTVIETQNVSYSQDNTNNQVGFNASFANGQSVNVTARFDPAGGAINSAFVQVNGTGVPTCIVPSGSSTNVCQALIVQTLFQVKDLAVDQLNARFLDASTVRVDYTGNLPLPVVTETKDLTYTQTGNAISFGSTFASSGRTVTVTSVIDATGHTTSVTMTQDGAAFNNCTLFAPDQWNCQP
jgi:hypothetical protein